MNLSTAIVLAALIAAVVLIIRKLIRDKRSGRTCAGCPSCSGGSCCCKTKKEA